MHEFIFYVPSYSATFLWLLKHFFQKKKEVPRLPVLRNALFYFQILNFYLYSFYYYYKIRDRVY